MLTVHDCFKVGTRVASHVVPQDATLKIESSSPLNVTCLPTDRISENVVIIPDDSQFALTSGNCIRQITSLPAAAREEFLHLPLAHDVEIKQLGVFLTNFFNYEGRTVTIESPGDINLNKLKMHSLSASSQNDISIEGVTEANLSLFAAGCISANKLLTGSAVIRFGGPKLQLNSVYCEHIEITSTADLASSETSGEENSQYIRIGNLRGVAAITIDGKADLRIENFEGSLLLRQLYGKVFVHVSGDCPSFELEVGEGDIELSLPLASTASEPSPVNAAVEFSASEINFNRNTIPENYFEHYEVSEMPGYVHYSGALGDADLGADSLWQVKILRGTLRITSRTWADAALSSLKHAIST